MKKDDKIVIGCIMGTRPELIKMAPIIHRLRLESWVRVIIINTAQHRSLLDNMFSLFEVTPDVDLDSMTINQSLGALTSTLCSKLDNLYREYKFDALLAAGDTTSVFVSSLIAFYHQIPFGHVEAGLRTYNAKEPFPEEINRVLTAPLAAWHYVPTEEEKSNLLRENISSDKIIVTGNPVIDALYWILNNKPNPSPLDLENIIVVTSHRRENFGMNLQQICQAIIDLSEKFPQVNFIIPIHPNPHVQEKMNLLLQNRPGIHLKPPFCYDEFVHLMNQSILIVTDSGGIQEEAPALGKPLVVLRNVTERPAVITEGLGVLVGTDSQEIVQVISALLTDSKLYHSMARGYSPYGDGQAARRIVESLKAYFKRSDDF